MNGARQSGVMNVHLKEAKAADGFGPFVHLMRSRIRRRCAHIKKGKDIIVMMWGAIYGDGRSDIIIMDREPDSEKSGYTASSYLAVLNDQLPRTWQAGMKFMQNNASICTVKKVKKWFEDEGI
jgi:hypothetical protein